MLRGHALVLERLEERVDVFGYCPLAFKDISPLEPGVRLLLGASSVSGFLAFVPRWRWSVVVVVVVPPGWVDAAGVGCCLCRGVCPVGYVLLMRFLWVSLVLSFGRWMTGHQAINVDRRCWLGA